MMSKMILFETKCQVVLNGIKYKRKTQHQIMNITVSIDGTWKRRGHIPSTLEMTFQYKECKI